MNIEKEPNRYFKNFLDENEKILWIGKPSPIPYSLSAVLFQIVGLLWFFIALPMLFQIESLSDFCFYILYLIPFWSSCFVSYASYKNINHVHYAYSRRRIFIKEGLGANYTIIEFSKIIDIESSSNLIENKYQTGSILIYSGKKNSKGEREFDVLHSIENPIDVFVDLKRMKANAL
ncbi:PH domain-containing protein [Aureispira sp. CCB-QB1]|uniref:PH domain-containing protein n=1 Tax=Aureispira sp. CCB-QB1 TaxID=1313421 RepID=UPI00069795E5|nr:PH domain-containing protein [Aureispira sp. CCB-QB1]